MSPEAQPQGLATLRGQRDRARRRMPPPRHPRARVEAPAAAGDDDTPPRQPEPIRAPDTATEPTAVSSGRRQGSAEPSPEETGATFKVTLYVDRGTDDFMEAARVAGLTARPKVDVSRSAVMRLALRRLMNDMTPFEVKGHLERQAVRKAGPGRRRR